MKYILASNAPTDITLMGGKGAALRALAETGLAIPAWFVIIPTAFKASLSSQQFNALQKAKKEPETQAILQEIALAPALILELRKALTLLCPEHQYLAVRSSAIDEDGADCSFAGQLESYLYVTLEDVPQRVVDVWRSGFSERVSQYRREAGLDFLPTPPAVLVQHMIPADRAGVAFAADPVSGRRSVTVVSAVFGLGTALVSGDVDADLIHINQQGTILAREIAEKHTAHQFNPDALNSIGTENLLPEQFHAPVLEDKEVHAIANLAHVATRYFGRPQDIEWAYHQKRLYLLQSRPITTLAELPDPDGERNIWDNSNIIESYGGVTTPLTFSFARRAYREVYRQFCRIMGVSERIISANETTFSRMLGLIQGRVYYNLLSWYRVLALLPGFTINRAFMEQMMGVKEGLPFEVTNQLAQKGSFAARMRDGWNLMRTIVGLVGNHFRLSRTIRHFYKRLEEALDSTTNLAELRADQLCYHYHSLESKLLTRWDAPLINDFFAMIFYGMLGKLSKKWCGELGAGLQNDLLCGEGGMISAEPAQQVRNMALIICDNVALIELLTKGTLAEIRAVLPQNPKLQAAYLAYLERFGDRCLDELKLESETLHDNPLMLFQSIGQLALRFRTTLPTQASSREVEIRAKAETRVKKALANHPLRRQGFAWILAHARARVRDRENLRFERTRLFGKVRRVFIELGRRLYAEDQLQKPRDIFYLEVDEILGFIEGTTTTTDLKALVQIRRQEYLYFHSTPAPSDRFITHGMVHSGHDFQEEIITPVATKGDLSGIGCCPGIVQGPVRVVHDPRNAALKAGEILVAKRTDPGWIILFPLAAGLLVERGSLLSHSAIVAREMGIPAIVSIPGITHILADGDWVELDGGSGIIRRSKEPSRRE